MTTVSLRPPGVVYLSQGRDGSPDPQNCLLVASLIYNRLGVGPAHRYMQVVCPAWTMDLTAALFTAINGLSVGIPYMNGRPIEGTSKIALVFSSVFTCGTCSGTGTRNHSANGSSTFTPFQCSLCRGRGWDFVVDYPNLIEEKKEG